MLKEFKEFAVKGSVVDLAVGFMIGGAFGTIVKSFVDDVLMPPIGLLLGNVDFANLFAVLKAGEPAGPYVTLSDAQEAGAVTVNYGLFVSSIVSFLIVVLALFFLVQSLNRLRREQPAAPAAPAARTCPFCVTEIPLTARRCPHCTSELEPA